MVFATVVLMMKLSSKNFRKNNMLVKRGMLLALSSILFACGGTGQDDGSPSDFQQDYAGLVIDGYLARATVFLDTNNDGTRNAWEPYAFTDDQGYFSYNPLTDTNYCAADASADQRQYCLITNSRYSNVVLRVDSGYDVLTGEPFVGQMSRRLFVPDEGSASDTLISPLTSLVTDLESENDQTGVLATLGLHSGDLDVDYLNADGNGQVDARLLNSALKVHKVVTVLSDRITDTYDQIGEEVGTPNDASSTVYREVARQLLTSGMSFDQTVADTTAMASVLDNAEQSMREVYERKEFDLPADMGNAADPGAFTRVIDVAARVVDVVNSLTDVTDGELDITQATGQARVLESVVIKALEEESQDATIDNAVDFLSSEENGALVTALVDSLAQDSGDVVALANNDFSGSDFDSVEEISQATRLPDDAAPFSRIAGLRIKVSDLDLGRGPDQLDDSEIEWYFNGSPEDTSGSFTACVKHIDDANIDGSLGEGSTRGEIVEGFWSLLGAQENNRQSYSLLITLTFLGTTYQAIMKPAGVETIGQVEYQRIRFDNDGQINVWHSADGFAEIAEVPATDEACVANLPSRIGIY